MQQEILDRLLEARQKQRGIALVTAIASGRQCLYPDDELGELGVDGGVQELTNFIDGCMRRDKSASINIAAERYFVQVHNRKLRMIIVGAVHIAQALVPLATIAGFAVTVVDPRRAFASDARFPAVSISTQWPDEALGNLKIDARTAVVTLTHDPKLDDPALHVALRSDAFYIGSLGSRRTHQSRLDRLREAGFDEKLFNRIDGPIGLDIGASSPAEIAISILAAVTLALRRGET